MACKWRLARMRTLTILSVLQTLGILVLVGHSFKGTNEVVAESSSRRPVAQVMPSSVATHVDDAADAADEQRLLQAIREELARLQNQLQMQGAVASPAVAEISRNDSVSRDARDSVAQQIENYRAMGPISEAQMFELQSAIVKLDPASRKQMMSRLIRALNAGELEGRL